MPWTFEYSKKIGIIRINIFGIYTPGDTDRLIADLNKEIKQSNCKHILVDCLQAKVEFTAMDIFNRPGVYELTGIPRDCKAAFLVPDKTKDVDFYEDVCNNRGFTVKAFIRKDLAVKWLQN
jgi:hypothetical protein